MSTPFLPPKDDIYTLVVKQHEGTDHLAINATFVRRHLTLFAMQTTARLYQDYGFTVPISKHHIVKMGPFVHLTEAVTMRYVAANTSVPVPHVHCAFVHKGLAYIVMQRVQGITLAKALSTYSQTDLESIFAQLRHMIDDLRSITPPSDTTVASCVGGSLRDSRIPRHEPRFGPFKTIQDFHLWLRDGLRPEDHPTHERNQDWQDFEEMVARQDGPWPAPVFTHGDLNPSNIIVRGDRVVAIIDWEFSGWYPHYWEYTSAWYGNRLRQQYQGMLTQFLDPYPDELKMEVTRQKWWGDF
ncbi:protein kinase-like domain-containing protein [Xylariomycetidae sp. FL2044]|nr:protein kinase-like domain-containing protein [Xylariomycetidae sp. FL2044]